MAKDTTVSGDLVTFSMKVKLDGNDDKAYEIGVEMDFNGVSRETLIEWNSGGSSRRVLLQAALRKTSYDRLAELEKTGLKVHASNVNDLKSPEEKLADSVKKMREMGFTKEQILAALEG
jgi:hypothetical protein